MASPFRETEDLPDGSDAIADWPLINFTLNAVYDASWVSFHHGGGLGIGIGNSLHAGMVIVADGTTEWEEWLRNFNSCGCWLRVNKKQGIFNLVD